MQETKGGKRTVQTSALLVEVDDDLQIVINTDDLITKALEEETGDVITQRAEEDRSTFIFSKQDFQFNVHAKEFTPDMHEESVILNKSLG